MTVKDYLRQIEKLRRLINNKLKEIGQLRDLISSIRAVSTDKENVQSSGPMDKLGESVAKIIDAENDTSALIDVYLDKRKTIISQIDEIEDANEYEVIHRRFVQSETFEAIAEEMSVSIRQILRIYDESMKKFAEKHKDVTKCH